MTQLPHRLTSSVYVGNLKKTFLCSTAKPKDYVSGKMWTVTLVTHVTTEGVTIESATIEAWQLKNRDQSMRRTDITGTSYGTKSWSPPANSLGTSKYLSLEFAAFGSGPDAKYSRATVVPFVVVFFFGSVHSYGFCAVSKTFYQSRSINLLREKRSVLKLTLISQPRSVSRNGHSAYSRRGWSGYDSQREK